MILTSIIKFDLITLYSFLVGIALGLGLFCLLYLILVLTNFKANKKYINTKKMASVDDSEVLEMIKEAQNMFKDKNIKGEMGNIGYCKELSFELVKDIARKFFPESKYPLYELTVDEVIMVSSYITNRVNDLLNNRGLRFFKKLKVSTFLEMGKIKKNIDDNPIVKATKKYKAKKILSAAFGILNIINPIYWVKRLVINTSLDIVTRKLCMMIIGIVGEETFKIYSKSVFNTKLEIDTNVEEILDEMENDLNTIRTDNSQAFEKEE